MAMCEAIKMQNLFGQLTTAEYSLFIQTLIETHSDYITHILQGLLYYVIKHNDNVNLALKCNGIMRRIILSRDKRNQSNVNMLLTENQTSPFS